VLLLIDNSVCGLELIKERLDYGVIFFEDRCNTYPYLKESIALRWLSTNPLLS
jgi:hypothetical protein